MQEWEYCVLTGVMASYPVRTHYPKIVFFTVDGPKYRILSKGNEDVPVEWRNKKEAEYVPAIIAEMGLQGWELVTVEDFTPIGYESYYFKRQIENRP